LAAYFARFLGGEFAPSDSRSLAGCCCHLVNGVEECGFVEFRWFVVAAYFPHELQGGGTDLFIVDGRIEIEEDSEVSAHWRHLDESSPPSACNRAIAKKFSHGRFASAMRMNYYARQATRRTFRAVRASPSKRRVNIHAHCGPFMQLCRLKPIFFICAMSPA
jgi:hypothetical protein